MQKISRQKLQPKNPEMDIQVLRSSETKYNKNIILLLIKSIITLFIKQELGKPVELNTTIQSPRQNVISRKDSVRR